MTSPVTPDPAIHTRVPKGLGGSQVQSPAEQFRNVLSQIPQAILNQVLGFIKDITGVDLTNIFDGIDISNPGAVLTSIGTIVQRAIQAVIDAIVNGFGHLGLGNVVDVIGNILSIPLQIIHGVASGLGNLQQIVQGWFAGLEGRVNALEATNPNNPVTPGTALGNGGSDQFNRNSIGPNWTSLEGPLEVVDGQKYVQTAGRSVGYYNLDHPATDRNGARITLANKMQGRSRLFICSNSTMSSYVAAEFYAGSFGKDAVRILSGTGPHTSVIQEQVNVTLHGGWTFEIKYDPDTNIYTVLKNGEEFGLEWEDVHNLITHGSSNRLVGIASNMDNAFFSRGFALQNFSYYDYATS